MLRIPWLLAGLAGCEAKALLFWAVDSEPRTIELVEKNVAHARASAGAECCDVALGHYAGSPALGWNKTWYDKEVTQSVVHPGYKFNLLRLAYQRSEHKWEDSYEFVWALDSDIDLQLTNIEQLFLLARRTSSSILSPTFSGPQDWRKYFSVDSMGATSDSKEMMRHQQIETDSRINVIGKSDPRCAYRRTDFVEMTAPLLGSKVLFLLLQDCTHCIQADAEWGLDRIWCKFAEKHVVSNKSPCAYLDQTPVLHLNWHKAHVTSAFAKSANTVRHYYPDLWSKVKTNSCEL